MDAYRGVIIGCASKAYAIQRQDDQSAAILRHNFFGF